MELTKQQELELNEFFDKILSFKEEIDNLSYNDADFNVFLNDLYNALENVECELVFKIGKEVM